MRDFICHTSPEIVMPQEIKKEIRDRRYVSNVWKVRNKEWASLLACGALS